MHSRLRSLRNACLPYRLAIWLSLVLLGTFFIAGHAWADARYGDNIYGACPYGQACPTTTTVTPTPTTPSPLTPIQTSTVTPTSNPPEPSSTRSPQPFVPGSTSSSPPPSGPVQERKNFGSSLERTAFGRFVKQQPVALPILLFILLLIMALILTLQAGLEHRNVIRMRRALQRLADVQTEVKNFLQILQHNLRTPIATMLLSLELLKTQHVKPAETAYELVNSLSESVNNLIDDVVSALKSPPQLEASSGTVIATPVDTIKSRLFWAPAITVAGLTLLYHILSWRLLSLRFETQLVILEVAVAFAAVIVLLASVGYFRRTRARRAILEQVAVDIKQLERHRASVVKRLQTELKQAYDVVPAALAKLPENHTSLMVMSGSADIGRLLQKFAIVGQLQDPEAFRSASLETYDIAQELMTVIKRVESAHAVSDAFEFDSVQAKVHAMMGFAGLVDFVLASALENAVRYRYGTSPVKAELTTHGDQNMIRIINQAQTISQADVGNMFEPFARTGDSLKMQTKGAGISLYVARVIMQRIGGSIELIVDNTSQVSCQIVIPIRVQPDLLDIDTRLLSGKN